MEENGPREGEEHVVYVSGQEAARRLGTTSGTVSRAAKKSRVGITVEGGRLVAIALTDIPKLREHIHEGPGNPDWIAAGRGKPRSPARRKAGRKTA
jgi:hypothetical protein